VLRGRNEEKVKFSADYLKRELLKKTAGLPGLILKGPAAAPLARAKTEYRFQIMLLTHQMSRLSLLLAELGAALTLPDEVKMTVDIDPVNLM
jgi:primosomal protein N'